MNKPTHFEVVSAAFTQATVAGSVAAAVTGDSLTVKNSLGPAMVLAAWCQLQADGFLQIVRPSNGHDNTRDFRVTVNANSPENIVPELGLDLVPQDVLAITIGEANTAGDIANMSMLIGYDRLRGSEGRYIDWPELKRRAKVFTTVEATIAATGAGGYSGEELITAESALLKANTDYALLGITTSVLCCSVTLRGPDTANKRIAVPGNPLRQSENASFFSRLSRQHGMPLIPVINTGNLADTYLGALQDENGADPLVTLHLAKLG